MPQVTDPLVERDELVITSTMSFRAIFAGWLIATGIACLLYSAGLALGFSSFDAWNAAGSAKGIGIGTAIWMILTWVAALFLGGMFASWFDGRDDDTGGALHGVTVWGLSMTATALWLVLGFSHAKARHGVMNMGDMHSVAADSHPAAMTGGDAVAVLDANLAHRLSSQPGDVHSHGATPIVAALIAGKDDVASALLAAQTGTSQTDAASSLQRLAPEVQAARREARLAADRASHYAAMTLWIVFLSAFLALIAAAIGGWLGATHVHRVYHLRNYPRRRVA
jgi:hypothetical protein